MLACETRPLKLPPPRATKSEPSNFPAMRTPMVLSLLTLSMPPINHRASKPEPGFAPGVDAIALLKPCSLICTAGSTTCTENSLSTICLPKRRAPILSPSHAFRSSGPGGVTASSPRRLTSPYDSFVFELVRCSAGRSSRISNAANFGGVTSSFVDPTVPQPVVHNVASRTPKHHTYGVRRDVMLRYYHWTCSARKKSRKCGRFHWYVRSIP